MNTIQNYTILGCMALLTVSIFSLHASKADAAPVCPIAKLYSSSSCVECMHIKKEAAASIAELVRVGRLEVFELDGNFAGDGLPDFQLFDPDTNKMLELFQADPLSVPHKDFVIKDTSGIVPRLNELAGQGECTGVLATSPSFFEQVSARGISSPVINGISNAVLKFFSHIGSGFMAVVEYFIR